MGMNVNALGMDLDLRTVYSDYARLIIKKLLRAKLPNKQLEKIVNDTTEKLADLAERVYDTGSKTGFGIPSGTGLLDLPFSRYLISRSTDENPIYQRQATRTMNAIERNVPSSDTSLMASIKAHNCQVTVGAADYFDRKYRPRGRNHHYWMIGQDAIGHLQLLAEDKLVQSQVKVYLAQQRF
jgi:hypothetical protein